MPSLSALFLQGRGKQLFIKMVFRINIFLQEQNETKMKLITSSERFHTHQHISALAGKSEGLLFCTPLIKIANMYLFYLSTQVVQIAFS